MGMGNCENCPNRESSVNLTGSFYFEQNDPMEMVLSSKSLSMMTNEQLMSVIDKADEDTIEHFGFMFTNELNKRGDSIIETIQSSHEHTISCDEATEAWLNGSQKEVDIYLDSLE